MRRDQVIPAGVVGGEEVGLDKIRAHSRRRSSATLMRYVGEPDRPAKTSIARLYRLRRVQRLGTSNIEWLHRTGNRR
jgi:hypothetical protein